MDEEGSVTQWLGRLQDGDPAAAQQLWARYFPRMVGLARSRLRALRGRAADEEDVALSAFDTLCRNAEQGSFPELQDRDSLWRLLLLITARKAAHLIRDEQRQKRGGRASVQSDDHVLCQILGREPTPDLAAEFADEWKRLLGLLQDAQLESVALLRMQGYSVEEIALTLGLASRSIKRKLQVIRNAWEKEMTP